MAGAEQGSGGDQAVAGLQVAEQGGVHRGHAGRRHPAALCAFQQGEAVLQHLDGGVAETAVLIVRGGALEGGLGLLGVVVDEAGGEE